MQRKIKKLQSKGEHLLVLMILRLRLLKQDLADRFCNSFTHYSNIVKTWIQLLNKTFRKVVACLPKESVIENIPKIFKTAGHGKLR